jgi:hypothetical protein
MANTTPVDLPDDLFEQLAREAAAQGNSPATFVEEATRQLLERRRQSAAAGEPPARPLERRFWGFISYSHTDERLAARLHRRLERYRTPRRLVGSTSAAGPVPRRISPFFRDQDEFDASSDLGERINRALGRSRYLIVICSPRAVASKWVNEEIARFRQNGGTPRVLCLIASGTPGARAGEHSELE